MVCCPSRPSHPSRSRPARPAPLAPSAHAVAAFLLLAGCTSTSTENRAAAPPETRLRDGGPRIALEAGSDARSVDASRSVQDATVDSSLPTKDGGANPSDASRDANTSRDSGARSDAAGGGAIDVHYDFQSPSPPTLSLIRAATISGDDLADPSVDPPEAHPYLLPSDLEFFPDGSGDSLLVLTYGLIVWLDADFRIRGSFQVDSANTLAKVRALTTPCGDNEGLLGLTFDPNFGTNHRFYIHLNQEHLGGVALFRLTWDPAHLDQIWAGRSTLFTIDKPQVATNLEYLHNHDGGNPSFGPDGYVYMAIGDGGVGGGLPWDTDLAPDLSSFWGKIVRIDPEGVAAPEIVASGLRNPFTHVWRGNEILIGDVSGDWAYCSDEIDRLVITPGVSAPPVDFGWPHAGGPCADSTLWAPCDTTTDPVHWYRKDSTAFLDEDPDSNFARPPAGEPNRSAIILGPVGGAQAYYGYLDRVLLYADLLQGWLRGVLLDDTGQRVADRHLLHHSDWITAFAKDGDGRIYVVGPTQGAVAISRIELKP